MTTIKYFSIFFIILSFRTLIAQTTGVGVANPAYNLDVLGSFRIQNQNASTTAGIWFDGSTSVPVRSFLGTFNDSHFGIYGNGGTGWNFLINTTNNNIGIGGITPEHRLDVNGRMRLQYDGATAGIWFDGTSLATRSFIGNINDEYIGIWGSGGAGWNFAMNVANRNTGIGTTTPTSRLDLNGTLRIRSNAPIKGSVLTSQDANGNAEWANPISFKAEGTFNNVNQSFSTQTWTKVLFNQSPAYNISNAYQPNTSVFVVPANGVYEFNTSVIFNSSANFSQSIRFVQRRSGVITTVAQKYNKGLFRNSSEGYFAEPVNLSFENNFIAGDEIWVEVWVASFNSGTVQISTGNTSIWFSGNLVSKL